MWVVGAETSARGLCVQVPRLARRSVLGQVRPLPQGGALGGVE